MGIAVIFPGQGTQATGMGAPWRDHPSWSVVDRADAALDEPLSSLILDAPTEQLARTRDAQLSVLLTSLVAWEAVRERIEAPIVFAGHSLGQVTALIASGALPLEEGVQFAARRAELTQAAADTHPGRMAALLGASLEQAEEACRAAPVKRATPLNVGGAFHTPLMRDAAEGLAAELPAVPLSPPDAPVVSNGDAQPYEDADGWRSRLAVHVTDPVRWRTSMETIAGMGATRCLEVGNGSMLATLAKRIVPDLPVQGVAAPEDLPALTEVR